MIHDKLSNLHLYLPDKYKVNIPKLLDTVSDNSAEEITQIDDDAYLRVMSYPTKLPKSAKIEAHNIYVDIQFSITGAEGISLYARENMKEISAKREKDFYEYEGNAPLLGNVANYPGYFTLIFPHEAHRPQESIDGECAMVKKGVVKIKAECF